MENKYGFIQYGLKPQTDIRRKFIAEDKLKMVSIHSGKDIPRTFIASERLIVKADGGMGIIARFASESSLTLLAAVVSTIPRDFISKSDLSVSGYISKDFEATFKPSDALQSGFKLVKDFPVMLTTTDEINLSADVAKDIARSILSTSGLYVETEAAFVDTETITINITLPPGGVLRIDTENYVVTMNEQNALNQQVGDWIKLARGLQDISVSSGTGGALEGSVTMTEAYL